MGYDCAAGNAELLMCETDLYSKTLLMNRLALEHNLPPVLCGVNRVESETVARIIMYAEGLVAQSPFAKYMSGVNQLKLRVINKLVILANPKRLRIGLGRCAGSMGSLPKWSSIGF